MKKVFVSIDGLDSKMVIAPEEVIDHSYDLLIVDEGHRLYKRKHLPFPSGKFDKINKKVMGPDFEGNEKDDTELDWIIKFSKNQIIFYDDLQRIRTPDIEQERFHEICKPHLYRSIELTSQMRCKGGNGYYEYVNKVLNQPRLSLKEYLSINNYNLEVVDSIDELFTRIILKDEEMGLCRVVCGPGWTSKQEIVIEGHHYHWSTGRLEKQNQTSILSIHKSQGFDLNYAGVIFGKEIYYDKDNQRIEIKKEELGDKHAKSSGKEKMREFVLNIYLILMTRGIEGTYVYAYDKNLREYFKDFFNK